MLSDPVARVAELFGVAGEIDGIPERVAAGRSLGYGRLIENAQSHGRSISMRLQHCTFVRRERSLDIACDEETDLAGDLCGTQFAKRTASPMDKPTGPPAPCPKCQSPKITVLGQSQQPVLTYFRCEACGHVFVPQINRS
jgi:hypothetical protein